MKSNLITSSCSNGNFSSHTFTSSACTSPPPNWVFSFFSDRFLHLCHRIQNSPIFLFLDFILDFHFFLQKSVLILFRDSSSLNTYCSNAIITRMQLFHIQNKLYNETVFQRLQNYHFTFQQTRCTPRSKSSLKCILYNRINHLSPS